MPREIQTTLSRIWTRVANSISYVSLSAHLNSLIKVNKLCRRTSRNTLVSPPNQPAPPMSKTVDQKLMVSYFVLWNINLCGLFNAYSFFCIYIRGAYDKFPNFFCMGTFIDSTHMELVPFEVISSGCNALGVPFPKILEGLMEVLLCELLKDLRHNLFHLLNCLITTISELRE